MTWDCWQPNVSAYRCDQNMHVFFTNNPSFFSSSNNHLTWLGICTRHNYSNGNYMFLYQIVFCFVRFIAFSIDIYKKVLWKICDVKNAKSGFLRQCLFHVVYCSICFKLKIVYGRKLIRWKKYLFFFRKKTTWSFCRIFNKRV